MSKLIKGIADVLTFNTTMVHVGISDVTNEHTNYRMRGGEGSSISFLVGHLASTRYGMLKSLGATDQNPFAEKWGGDNAARDASEYLDISELAADWDELGVIVADALAGITDEQALATSPAKLPVSDTSHRGALGFFARHESYHVGQIGLLRTELGYQALRYRLYEHVEAQAAGA